jgi:hypothetical protein
VKWVTRRRPSSPLAPALAVGACAVGVAGLAPAPAYARVQSGAATVVVTLTNAKLELVPATVPVGTVVFKIRNEGTIPRDFRIGITGERTARIAVGKSAMLKVKFSTGASIFVLSYGAGGTAGLSNAFTVVASCTNPATSTVTVRMREAPERFSRPTVPCGTVKFVVTNVGTIVHSFQINAPGGHGPRISPGQTVTMTVHLTTKGKVFYYCNETEHNEMYGEYGYLRVV